MKEKFSDVVNWLKANASKAENSVADAGAAFSAKKLLPEVVNKENKSFGEKTGFTPDTTATNFASPWTPGLFSSSQSIFGSGRSILIFKNVANNFRWKIIRSIAFGAWMYASQGKSKPVSGNSFSPESNWFFVQKLSQKANKKKMTIFQK